MVENGALHKTNSITYHDRDRIDIIPKTMTVYSNDDILTVRGEGADILNTNTIMINVSLDHHQSLL